VAADGDGVVAAHEHAELLGGHARWSLGKTRHSPRHWSPRHFVI
jgi:hypothetical protein